MSDDDIALVRESWACVLPQADTAMTMFYDQLFEMDADVAQQFSGKNMAAQRLRLATAIDRVVQRLDRPETLTQALQDLGARHVAYGVAEADFAKAGAALLSALRLGLPDLWTHDHARAWSAAWETVAAQILTGYRQELAA